jgi:hypothetical protein
LDMLTSIVLSHGNSQVSTLIHLCIGYLSHVLPNF